MPVVAMTGASAGLAERLRSELAGSAIHVSVVFPISTPTEFHDVMARESGAATRAAGPRQSVDEVAPGFCDRLVKQFGRQRIT